MANNKMLLIIDAQYDFIEGGSLAVNGSKNKLDKLCEQIKNENYDTIVFTVDWHPINHCSFTNNGGQWPVHCVQHTHGAAIYEPLFKAAVNNCKNVNMLTKGNVSRTEEYSVMDNHISSKELCRIIDFTNPKQIDVCGIASEYCVFESIQGLLKHNYKDKLNVMPEYIGCIESNDKLISFCNEENIKIQY